MLFVFILFFAGCGARNELAPVSELNKQSFSRAQKNYIVHAGDTLYAIAFGFDTDFRQLARLNHLKPPYKLHVGQVLNVRQSATFKKPVPQQNRHTKTYNSKPLSRVIHDEPKYLHSLSSSWHWPVKGRVVTGFMPTQGKKGINIASAKGENVHAASSGVVAYAGSGLPGYGNLIIIKHDNEYLTAYGNNDKNLVSEGQHVTAGQVIAVLGVIDHKYWGVHFEIRKKGVPVNPLTYLR